MRGTFLQSLTIDALLLDSPIGELVLSQLVRRARHLEEAMGGLSPIETAYANFNVRAEGSFVSPDHLGIQ